MPVHGTGMNVSPLAKYLTVVRVIVWGFIPRVRGGLTYIMNYDIVQ